MQRKTKHTITTILLIIVIVMVIYGLMVFEKRSNKFYCEKEEKEIVKWMTNTIQKLNTERRK